MKLFLIVFGFLVVLFAAASFIASRKLKSFTNRGPAIHLWRAKFPKASTEEIRTFLEIFTEAFAINKKHGMALQPEDAIFAIYATRVNPNLPVDSLECETLLVMIEYHYNKNLANHLQKNTTLGELFELTRPTVD